MEYLSIRGGCTTSVEYVFTGGVHHLSGSFIPKGGGTPPQWNIYPERGGGPPQWNIYPEEGSTPPQWNIYPHRLGGIPPQWNTYSEGEVHHVNGILIQRGGGTLPPWNIFPRLSFSPLPHFSTLFFPLGGGYSPVLHGLPFFPTFNFHDGFFSSGWLCWGRGGARLFRIPF